MPLCPLHLFRREQQVLWELPEDIASHPAKAEEIYQVAIYSVETTLCQTIP